MSTLALLKERDEKVRCRLTVFFVSAALSVALLYRHFPGPRFWLPAALAGIALAIWHGAYDAVLAADLWQSRRPGRWLPLFVAGYVALTAVVVVAWYVIPAAALVAFLLYSGFHFGSETEREQGFLQMTSATAFGCLSVAAACYWQAASVLPIFVSMLRGGSDIAERCISAAGVLLVPCVFLAIVPVWQDRGLAVRRAALTASQLLLFRFCPPVLAFAVFFCLLHTPEHLIETSRSATHRFSRGRLWCNLRAGLIPWLISLVAVAVAAWVGRQTVQAYTASLFIALSALTVPHMTLAMLRTAEIRRREKLPSASVQRAVLT